MRQIPKGLTKKGRADWLRDYPLGIEEFGKDTTNALHMLLGYKTDEESVLSLRQGLNTLRSILLNSTRGTFDLAKLGAGPDGKITWPAWQITDTTERTLLVVEEDNGERWEDYHTWPAAAYWVYAKKTGDELDAEWKAHVTTKALEVGITVNPHHPNHIMTGSKVKSERKLKKVLRDNGFYKWLESAYRTERVDFAKVHVY